MKPNYYAVLLLCLIPLFSHAQWSKIQLPNNTPFHTVDVPTAGLTIGSQNYGMYSTKNGGQNWTGIDKVFTNYDPEKFYLFDTYNERVHFVDENIGFFYGLNTWFPPHGVIFKTIDGGSTWTLVYSEAIVNINHIFFATPRVGYALCNFGRILKTIDQGSTWTLLDPPKVDNLRAIHFFTEDAGVAAGDNAVLKTSDGGAHWTKISIPFVISSISFFDNQTGLAIGDGVIYKTKDGGVTWNKSLANLPTNMQLFKVLCLDDKLAFVSSSNGLFKTIDGGGFWFREWSVSGSISDFDFTKDKKTGLVSSSHQEIPYTRGYFTSTGGNPLPLNEALITGTQKYPESSCRGEYPVKARLVNQGINPLTTATIRWSVNGDEQTPFHWTGNLSSADTSDLITVGVHNFNKTQHTYKIKVWSDAPNGAADAYSGNDLDSTTFLFKKFVGEYSIGAGNDFESLQTAFFHLQSSGNCGDVIFSISNGTYTVPGSFRENYAFNPEYSLTIRSASGNAQDVVFLQSETTRLDIRDVQNLHIENVTFNSQFGFAISGYGFLNNFVVKECIFNSSPTTGGISLYAEGNITIEGCRFSGGATAINLADIYWHTPDKTYTKVIRGNTFENQQTEAINAPSIHANVRISGNIIRREEADGMYFSGIVAEASGNNLLIDNNYLLLKNSRPDNYITGIVLEGEGGAQIAFNTSIIDGGSSTNNQQPDNDALHLSLRGSGANIIVRNNNLANYGNGSALRLIGPADIVSDYNNLFGTEFVASYQSTSISFAERTRSVASWTAVSGGDKHSTSVDPEVEWTSNEFVAVSSNYALNEAAIPFPSVPTDLTGKTRDATHPDIGAFEFDLSEKDLAVVNINYTPKTCDQGGPLNVRVKNFGTTAVPGFYLQWRTDVETKKVTVTDLVEAGSEMVVSLGDVILSGPRAAIFAQVTTSGDANIHNDTLSIHVKASGMSGNYTVGNSGANYSTIAEAIAALKKNGVCGPVVVSVQPGNYDELLVFPLIEGASEKNTITFQSEALDSASVTIITRKEPVLFDNATWITLQYFTIKLMERDFDHDKVIQFAGNVQHNTISFNQILGGRYGIVGGGVFRPSIVEYNLISQNHFIQCHVALGSFGVYALFARGNQIEKNRFSSGAISVFWQDGILILGNVLSGKGSAIGASDVLNAYRIESNILSGGTNAEGVGVGEISISNGANMVRKYGAQGIIANNIIEKFSSGYISNFRFINNTVVLPREFPGIAVNINAMTDRDVKCDNIDVLNNIVVASSGYLYGVHPYHSVHSDYNIFYSPPSENFLTNYSNSLLVPMQTYLYDGLYQWQQRTGHDPHSLFLRPNFVSAENFHIDNDSRLKAKGTDVQLAYDIDGNARNESSPDIGADEFTIVATADDAGISSIVRPDNCSGDNTLKAVIKNYGTTALTSAKIFYKINNSDPQHVSWSGNVSSGNDSEEITLTEYIFSPADSFMIKVWTQSPNGKADGNSFNDSISMKDLYPRLNGSYTVSKTSPADFSSLVSLVKYLSRVGVCGPVNVTIEPGFYDEYPGVYLEKIPGASAKNRVTLQGNPDEATYVDLQTSRNDYGLVIDGVEYVTIRDMKLRTSFGRWGVIGFQHYSNSVEIINNDFQSPVVFENGEHVNVLIEHNRGGMILSNFGSHLSSAVIRSNSVAGIKIDGLSTSIDIDKNEINGGNGVSLYAADGKFLVRNNIIKGFSYGLSLRYCGRQEGEAGEVNNNFIIGNGNAYTGINLFENENIRFVYNNVYMVQKHVYGYDKIALRSHLDTALYILNNNFITASKGWPVEFDNVDTATFTVDHNNIWSASGVYREEPASFDKNSIRIDPIYVSEEDLHVLNAALKGKGIPVPGIETDIDGEQRNPTQPDIGADEFIPYQSDAGIVAIEVNPTLCLGDNDVRVILKNYGSIMLHAVTIKWEISGVAQPDYEWTGNLSQGENSDPFVIGQLNFTEVGFKSVLVTIVTANGLDDPEPGNNTMTRVDIHASARGKYTIGSGGDFSTISAAVDMLETYGVCGPVTFLIRDGVYTEQVIIENIKGTSAVNPLIFRSESGNAESVKVVGVITENIHPYVWGINAVNNVTIQDISIDGSAINECFGVWIAGSPKEIRIVNNIIDSNVGITTMYGGVMYQSAISGNIIRGGKMAISLSGNYHDQYNPSTVQDTISRNKLIGQKMFGIAGVRICGYKVIDNEIISEDATDGYQAIRFLMECRGNLISQNRIDARGTGIYLDDVKNTTIENNFVIVRETGPWQTPTGIHLLKTEQMFLYYNSVHVQSTHADAAALRREYLYDYGLGPSIFRNNIFVNTGGGVALVHYRQDVPYVAENNDLYSSGPTVVREIFNAITNNYAKLSEWQGARATEKNSLSVDPGFVSTSDLHASSQAIAGKGVSVEIKYDIDGELRHPTLPTIGADEFGMSRARDLSTMLLGGDLCLSAFEVGLTIRNSGTLTISTFKINYTINDITQTPINWTGSLKPGDSETHVFSNLPKNESVSLKVDVNAPNGQADEYPADNSNEYTFATYTPVKLGADRVDCSMAELTLDAGTGFANYSWNTGGTSSSLQVSTSGVYEVTVKDENGCASHDDILVYLVDDVEVTLTSSAIQFCSNESVELTATPSIANENYSYQWFKDGEPLSSTTEPGLTVNLSGTYSVALSYSQCSDVSNEIILSTITAPIASVTFESNELHSTPGESYQWYLDNSPVEGEVSQSLSPISEGYYQVKVFSGSCSALSDSVHLIVTDLQETVSESVRIYPNPAVKFIFVEKSPNVIVEDVGLMDLAGHKIQMQYEIIENMYRFDISVISPGTYYLVLKAKEKTFIRKLIVVR